MLSMREGQSLFWREGSGFGAGLRQAGWREAGVRAAAWAFLRAMFAFSAAASRSRRGGGLGGGLCSGGRLLGMAPS
jgi:hypothetical protein